MEKLDLKKPIQVVNTTHGDSALCVSSILFFNEERIFCEVRAKDWNPEDGDVFSYLLFDRVNNVSYVNPALIPDGVVPWSEYASQYRLENYEPEAKPNWTLPQRAREFARSAHLRVGQTYDDKPYIFHVDMAASFAWKYKHLIPDADFPIVLAGVYLHDVPEDVHFITYNPLMKEFGQRIADIAHACANEKGRNRKERANDKYYDGIRRTKNADFAKCCDRLANIKHGVDKGGGDMLDGYRKEHKHFKGELFIDHLSPMFEEMEQLLGLVIA